jgi:transketolase
MTPAQLVTASALEGSGTADIDLDKYRRMANAIRALSMDAVEQAQSGHPGMPMGMADVATVLFSRFLKFDPRVPDWPDRDRFVLSAGHGSMLLYSLLYLLGYEDMTIEEIRNFRQLGSRTPGHPEYGFAAGVETTTGPLGQGLANAVGMAIAERHLAARFGEALVDHRTYVIVGDGCLMEGISQEAISLAGHLRLARLTVLFDDNSVTIDGPLGLSDSTDQLARFAASGWNVAAIDGHDPIAIAEALEAAQTSDRPSFIACKTIIGYGAPKKQGTAAVHGAPLGAEEVAAVRSQLGWEHAPFDVPTDVRDAWRIVGLRGCRDRRSWQSRLEAADPEQSAQFERCMAGDLPENFGEVLRQYKKVLSEQPLAQATRSASQNVLEIINSVVPETVGGSADLTPSNNTRTNQFEVMAPGSYAGRYIHYGIREHAMAAAMNGMAVHGGVIPYGGTFLTFSDYCRPSIRLAALMGVRVVFVMTHDSIGLGEDGPTHQAVEHMASLRAIPNLTVMRPADSVETAECWQLAMEQRHTPSVLALTRQKVPAVRTRFYKENLCARGAYEIASSERGRASVVVFASGSEVQIALAAKTALEMEGEAVRVVSVPSMELFFAQDDEYRASLLGEEPVRVAIEAGVRMGWEPFIGRDGAFIGMTGFGASAPYEDVYRHFGITAEAAVTAAKLKLSKLQH